MLTVREYLDWGVWCNEAGQTDHAFIKKTSLAMPKGSFIYADYLQLELLQLLNEGDWPLARAFINGMMAWLEDDPMQSHAGKLKVFTVMCNV